MKLKNRLREILLDRKMSHYKLADMIGVNRPLVTRWCQNVWQPLNYALKICDALKITMADLYFAEDKEGNKYFFKKPKHDN